MQFSIRSTKARAKSRETRLNPLPHPEVLPSFIAQIFLNDYGRPAEMILLLQLGGVKRQQLEL
jgi:hypothetical protein